MKWTLTDEEYGNLFKKSAMLSPAKIPIILLLGKKDLTVPYQSSIAYAA